MSISVLEQPASRRAFLQLSESTAKATPAPVPSLAAHAANRLLYGPRQGDVAAIESQGYEAFLAQHLNPGAINDSACDALLAALPRETLSETWAQLYDRRSLPNWNNVILPFNQTRHATVVRRASSRRQLYERLVEFWHDHFSIYGLEFIVASLFPKWDETIRQHALGNFRAFLEATAAHPCMLYYLDNYISTNAGPNENYAREVFELHTLGRMNYQTQGGYVDDDVYESSRCFTGWTFERSGTDPNRGQFKYVHEQHDRFMKWVLGQRIPNDQAPLKDGRDVLDLIAFHPGTARHIAWKLAQRFIADEPPASIVDSTAAVFSNFKDDPAQIRKTLEHLLSSEEFKAEEHRAVKFKRPADWLISTMRALNIAYPLHDSFFWDFNNMGHRFFEWRSPDGPPDVTRKWATSNGLLQRWNYIFRVASGWWSGNGYTLNVSGRMPADRETAREIVQWWVDNLIQRPVSSATMNGLIDFIAEGRNPDLRLPASQIESKVHYLAAVIVMTPEFQRR
jgi:uncharacterized protein (DUF1800 family)